jgi:hypothetical protein
MMLGAPMIIHHEGTKATKDSLHAGQGVLRVLRVFVVNTAAISAYTRDRGR